MLTRNHTIQITRNLHDARDRFVGLVQHVIIIRVHGDIGVYIAIACVHVQSDEHPRAQDFFVYFLELVHNFRKGQTCENPTHLWTHFAFVRQANGAVLNHVKQTHLGLRAQTGV